MRAWLDRHGPPLLFLAAVALAFLYKTVLFGAWPQVGDVVEQFYPWEVFARRVLADGQVPLWNPYNSCGMPFLANLQSSVFYPVEMLLFPIPAGPAIGWSTVLHFLIAGWGGYFMALRFGANRWGGTLAGLAYMLNGFAMIHLFAGNTLTLYAAAWAPWAFLAAEWAFQAKGWRGYLLGGSVIWALHFLCGHAQMTFYSAVFTSLYVLVRALVSRKGSDVTALGKFFTAAAFGVLLASIQFIPTAEYAALSSRSGGLDYEAATEFSLPPNRVINFFLPDFFGSHADLVVYSRTLTGGYRAHNSFWAHWTGWSNNYVGILTVLLAVGVIFWGIREKRWKSSRSMALIAVTVMAFFCAAGRFTPVYEWIFPLPGFRLFRAPSKFTPYLLLPLLIAAGIGFSKMITTFSAERRRPLTQEGRFTWVSLVLGLLLFVGTLYLGVHHLPKYRFVESMFFGDRTNTIRAVAVTRAVAHFVSVLLLISVLLRKVRFGRLQLRWAGMLLLLVLAADLGAFGVRYMRGFRSDAFDVAWKDSIKSQVGGFRLGVSEEVPFAPNQFLLYYQEVTGAYDPLSVGRYAQFVSDMRGEDTQFKDVLFTPLGDRGNALSGTSRLMGRAGMGRGYSFVETPSLNHRSRFYVGEAMPATSRYPSDAHREVVVRDAPDGNNLLVSGPTVVPNLQRLDKQGTTLLELDAPADGWLYLADVYYPGWVARDEFGTEYEIVPANHAFRAIQLPKGQHRITFSYEPLSFRMGLWLTTGAGLVWLGLLLLEARGRRVAKCARANSR